MDGLDWIGQITKKHQAVCSKTVGELKEESFHEMCTRRKSSPAGWEI